MCFSITQLRDALRLSMTLHRAVIRQGSSLIDKRAIRTMRGHRVVVVQQGPDLALFCQPGALARLARWLVDAMRDRVAGTNISNYTKKKSLPFVVACLNEKEETYLVVGINAALEFGDVRKKWVMWRSSFRILLTIPRIVSLALHFWTQRKGVTREQDTVHLIRMSWR